MDYTNLLENVPLDNDLIEYALNSGNVAPLSEFIGLREDLEEKMNARQSDIPIMWLTRYKTILWIIDYLIVYYNRNNLSFDFNVHGRKL